MNLALAILGVSGSLLTLVLMFFKWRKYKKSLDPINDEMKKVKEADSPEDWTEIFLRK